MVEGSIAPRLRKYADYTGVAAALAFAFFAWLSTAGANIAFILLLATLALDRDAYKTLRTDLVFIMTVIFGTYIIFKTLWPHPESAEIRNMRWDDAGRWLKLLAFVAMAWQLRKKPELIKYVMVLGLLGLLLGTLIEANLIELVQAKIPTRTGFKLSIGFSGFINSIAIFGLLIFAPRIFYWPQTTQYKIIIGILWSISVFITLYSVITSQSRQSWLVDTVIAIPILALFYAKKSLKNKTFLIRSFAPIAIALALIGGLAISNFSLITSRLQAEQTTIDAIRKVDGSTIPKTSLGYRFNVLVFGLRKWAERPMMGWGTGSTKFLIKNSGHEELKLDEHWEGTDWLVHFHNTYLELLVRFGVVGALLCTIISFLLIKSLVGAYLRNSLSFDYFIFFAGSFAILAFSALFGIRALHIEGRAFLILLFGIIYSLDNQSHLDGSKPRAHRSSTTA
jgi:O-antigen ligase